LKLEEPNELNILVMRAKELKIMDTKLLGKGGSSDPLVIMNCNGVSKRTTTKNKNLNPVWNEVYRIPATSTQSSLEVVMEDDDAVKNDFMGKVTIPLFSLFDKHTETRWYKLTDQKGRTTENNGQLQLSVKWVYNPALKIVAKKIDSDAEDDDEDPDLQKTEKKS